MACPRCGSWSVRSDRSLAGRMVCGRCGTALPGVGSRGRGVWPVLSRGGPWRWWFAAVLILAAGLAALAPEAQRQPGLHDANPADGHQDRSRPAL